MGLPHFINPNSASIWGCHRREPSSMQSASSHFGFNCSTFLGGSWGQKNRKPSPSHPSHHNFDGWYDRYTLPFPVMGIFSQGKWIICAKKGSSQHGLLNEMKIMNPCGSSCTFLARVAGEKLRTITRIIWRVFCIFPDSGHGSTGNG